MSDATPYLKLGTASRHAAILTIIGAAIVFASMIYSALSLIETKAQRNQLTTEISVLNKQLTSIESILEQKKAELAQSQTTINRLEQDRQELLAKITGEESESIKLNEQLSQARCALMASRSAVEAFHQHDYTNAINLYSEALACDPNNAYILNLKAYSLFKAGRVEEAIRTERESVAADPSYAWGYFDLARFLCSGNPSDLSEARTAVNRALKLRPDLEQIMRGDGEFMRLCKGVLP